jgi:hypothetical protein
MQVRLEEEEESDENDDDDPIAVCIVGFKGT